MFNINTALKQLEHWVAPKEIEKSGFGKLKIKGQDVTVCAKVVGDIHKIGEQLRLLGNSNKTKGKQDWEGNEPAVQELISQIHELGATLEGMKAASSQLKTRDEIKAAIKFTKQIASKVGQIEDAIGGITNKVDDTSREFLLGINNGLLDDVKTKNADVRADLTKMKISKHVKPEAKAKMDFLKVYAGVSKLPGIGKLIKGLAGLFVNLDAKVQTRLDTQLDSLQGSLNQLNTVSGNITSSTEAEELLKRTQEAKDRISDLNGIARAVGNSSNNFDLLSTTYVVENQASNMLNQLSQLQTTLQQKQELLKQQEALPPIKVDFDRTHEFDISSARTLLNKLQGCKRDLSAATPNGIAPENEQINQNLLTQIGALAIRATLRLERFGLIKTDEAGLGSYHVTVENLEKQYQELQREVVSVAIEANKNPGLAQHMHIRLSERITQFEGLQEHTGGEKPELTAHKTHIEELRTALKESEVVIRRNLQLEATNLKGQTEGLTGIFEELDRLAADHQTPEAERLKEINAHLGVANGIRRNLQNNPVQRESPNYQTYDKEISRAKTAVAMASQLISNFNEKNALKNIQTGLSQLETERAKLLPPNLDLENSAAQQDREENLNRLADVLQNIDSILKKIVLEKTSPNKALFDDIQASLATLHGEVKKNCYENQVGILTSEISIFSQEVDKNFAEATLDDTNRWQEDLARREGDMKKILDQLPADQRTDKTSVELETFNTTAADLKNLLGDRKILIENRDRLNEINKLIEQKIINNNDISFGDRLGLLKYQIENSLPEMKASLAGLSTTDPEKKNYPYYKQLVYDMDLTLRNLTQIQLGHERSAESFPKLEKLGQDMQNKISKKIEAIRDNVALDTTVRSRTLKNCMDEVKKFQKLSESLTTYLPPGKELSTLKERNADRVQALTILVEDLLQATTDLIENMKAAKPEIRAIRYAGFLIESEIQASKNREKVWKLNQENTLKTLTILEQSLKKLRECRNKAGEGSVERKQIDEAIVKGEGQIVTYQTFILNKSRDDIMEKLNNIRYNEDDSLEVMHGSLTELAPELTKLKDFLIKSKIDENKINEIYNQLEQEVNKNKDIVKQIELLTKQVNSISDITKNTADLNLLQREEITNINKSYLDCKGSAGQGHYSNHFNALEDLLKPLMIKVNTTYI